MIILAEKQRLILALLYKAKGTRKDCRYEGLRVSQFPDEWGDQHSNLQTLYQNGLIHKLKEHGKPVIYSITNEGIRRLEEG